jgi:hypothetical protein
MSKIEMQSGETILHEQVLFYIPEAGQKLNGKLTVTNQRILYEAKYEASLVGTIESTLLFTWGTDYGMLVIPKSMVASVAV